MAKAKTKRTFFELFETDRPVLRVKFDVNGTSQPTEIEVKNHLERSVDAKGLEKLKGVCTNTALSDFVGFYTKCNGFALAAPVLPANAIKTPLLQQVAAGQLEEFTKQYLLKGKLAWIIDLNKTKTLYREEGKWLAFALVDGGPSCLTIFLEGENAGCVFLANPQPHFNTLKPIAKSFTLFLERVATDPAAFFKLTKAYVTLTTGNSNFGYLPVEYVDGGGILSPGAGENASMKTIRAKDEGPETQSGLKGKWWKLW